MEQASWYAVYTASRAEKRVQERLDQAGITNYLPFRVVEREREGQIRRIVVPVICGCFFVRVSKTDFFKVVSTSGVISFLKESEIPVIIPDKQIECLRIMNDNAEDIEVVEVNVPSGVMVRVVHGKLSGLEGELMESLGEHRILVRLQHLGGVLTTIPQGSVERIV